MEKLSLCLLQAHNWRISFLNCGWWMHEFIYIAITEAGMLNVKFMPTLLQSIVTAGAEGGRHIHITERCYALLKSILIVGIFKLFFIQGSFGHKLASPLGHHCPYMIWQRLEPDRFIVLQILLADIRYLQIYLHRPL